jgi:hypothetical protein
MRQRFGEGFVYLMVTLYRVAVMCLLLIVQWQIILHGMGWGVQSLLYICCNTADISLVCLNSVTTQQCHNTTVSQQKSVTTQQCDNTTVWQHNSVTTQQCHNTTLSQHNNVTTQQCHNSTVSQINSVKTQQCHNSTVWQHNSVTTEQKSNATGKRVSKGVDHGGRRIIKKKKHSSMRFLF